MTPLMLMEVRRAMEAHGEERVRVDVSVVTVLAIAEACQIVIRHFAKPEDSGSTRLMESFVAQAAEKLEAIAPALKFFVLAQAEEVYDAMGGAKGDE